MDEQEKWWERVHPSMSEFCRQGAFTENMAHVMEAFVRGKINIVISGVTDSGKTELLTALCACIEPSEKAMMLEPVNSDVAALRKAAQTGINRLIVNDIANYPVDLLLSLMSMTYGVFHGSIMTATAESPSECLQHLETQVSASNSTLSDGAIKKMISDAVNLIIQTARMPDGMWRITEFVELKLNGDDYSTLRMFNSDPLVSMRILEQLENRRIAFALAWLQPTDNVTAR